MHVPELFSVNPQNVIASEDHSGNRVSITITNPSTPDQTVPTNFITINGTTSDYGHSGIKKVEVLLTKIPFNENVTNYKLATPVTQGDWSRWSFPVVLKGTGSYVVRSRVTDNTGNQNWTDTTIHFPPYMYIKRIAFVEPTFTYAAYHSNSFYNFYAKYSPLIGKLSNGSKITTDLNLLKNRPIPHGPFPYYAHPQRSDIPYIEYFKLLLQQVKKNSPFTTNLTDVDVHEGKIFQTNGENAYDVLFLFHTEYATDSEYYNLRQFVSNGGTIVFAEANILFAEVSYNKTNDSITLVNGHYWKFNGKAAMPSVGERWLNENREWMGSNFFDVPSTKYQVHFANNPFNYTHTEEQYVTNPQAKILIDYHVYDIPNHYKYYQNATVAAYQMNYGKGKIINLGIWGHVVEDNKAFLNYFDNLIVPLALGPPINSMEHLHNEVLNINNAGSIILVPAAGPSGAVVSYILPSVISNSDGQFSPACRPPSGSRFPIGETIVKCIATDRANNTLIATFTIQVQDMISH
jgi:hypothetical protein